MSEHSAVQKAMLVLDDLNSNGGLLSVEQNDKFITLIEDEPTLINDIRTVKMNGPSQKLNRIGFGGRILRRADQTEGSRALTRDKYAKPITSKIEMNTKEIIAELHLPYEVLEDNIEGEELETTVLALIAERAALDLEELILKGDTSVAATDDYLGMMNGVMRLTSSNIVDALGAPISASTFNNAIKALPTRYRRNRNAMRLYTPMDVEQDYRMALTSRGSALGDSILTGNAPVPVFGIPMKGAALMDQDKMLFTNPQNLIFGVQRNIRIESQRLIAEREIQIVLTMRCAIAVEDEMASVKVINIGAA